MSTSRNAAFATFYKIAFPHKSYSIRLVATFDWPFKYSTKRIPTECIKVTSDPDCKNESCPPTISKSEKYSLSDFGIQFKWLRNLTELALSSCVKNSWRKSKRNPPGEKKLGKEIIPSSGFEYENYEFWNKLLRNVGQPVKAVKAAVETDTRGGKRRNGGEKRFTKWW